MSFYGDARNNCCPACAWGRAAAQVTNEPFDEAWLHVAVKTLVEGDFLRTVGRPGGPEAPHVLGRALGKNRVKWEDEAEHRLLGGTQRVLRLVRDGEDRGLLGRLGKVERAAVVRLP